MKIHLELFGVVIEYRRTPMEPERFAALCKLAGFAIYGCAVVALVHMLDVWGLVWSLAGLVAAGVYKLIRGGFINY